MQHCEFLKMTEVGWNT